MSYDKEKYERNKVEILEKRKLYYAQNKQKILSKRKKYYTENSSEIVEDRRVYRKKQKERTKNTDLKANFNITLEDYKMMLVEQNGNCKICSRNVSEFTRALYVDHCHKTGKIRGLLCCRCNLAIGSFKDSVELLKSAIDYLETHHV